MRTVLMDGVRFERIGDKYRVMKVVAGNITSEAYLDRLELHNLLEEQQQPSLSDQGQ